MLEQIVAEDILYALILRREFNESGIHFFTPPDFSQQLGYMNRPKNYIISPHYHEIQLREINLTQEVLLIKSGRVQAIFYDNFQQKILDKILNTGDVLMLIQGGHGFKMLEESEIIEIKQGPYRFETDKKYIHDICF